MKMKAIEVKERGGQLELVEKDVPEAGAGQVRVKVQACGVCHGEAVLASSWPLRRTAKRLLRCFRAVLKIGE